MMHFFGGFAFARLAGSVRRCHSLTPCSFPAHAHRGMATALPFGVHRPDLKLGLPFGQASKIAKRLFAHERTCRAVNILSAPIARAHNPIAFLRRPFALFANAVAQVRAIFAISFFCLECHPACLAARVGVFIPPPLRQVAFAGTEPLRRVSVTRVKQLLAKLAVFGIA